MIPFRTDPRWYEEHWYGDPADESEAEAAPKRATGRFRRAAVRVAQLVAEAAGGRPVPETAPIYPD